MNSNIEMESEGRPRPLIDRVLAGLLPSGHRTQDGGIRSLLWVFGIALAIRLPLMPIACHADLISTYHRSYTMLNDFFPRWWLPHQLIQSAFLKLYAPLLALDELIGWEQLPHTASTEFWLESFAPHPQVFLALFLFKLPYLVCDLAIALVLLRIFADSPVRGLKAATMWLFNPATIFAFYVFGRHDSVAILFIALGVLAIRRSDPLRGSIALGVAIWSRYWPVFLLPLLAAFGATHWRGRLKIIVLGLTPALIYNVVVWMLSVRDAPAPAVTMARSTFGGYLLNLDFDLGWTQNLYVFPTLFALLVMYALVAKPTEDPFTRFCRFSACFLSIFYATSFFHPQYFTWCILFLVILRASRESVVLRNLHYAQLLLLVPYTFFWRKSLFGYLFAPLDPEFFAALSTPTDWIEPYLSPYTFVNFFRSCLSAVCLCMAGWLLFSGAKHASPASLPVTQGEQPAG